MKTYICLVRVEASFNEAKLCTQQKHNVACPDIAFIRLTASLLFNQYIEVPSYSAFDISKKVAYFCAALLLRRSKLAIFVMIQCKTFVVTTVHKKVKFYSSILKIHSHFLHIKIIAKLDRVSGLDSGFQQCHFFTISQIFTVL